MVTRTHINVTFILLLPLLLYSDNPAKIKGVPYCNFGESTDVEQNPVSGFDGS
jgi:hypothetical protein